MKKLTLIITDENGIISTDLSSKNLYLTDIIYYLESIKFALLLREQKASKKGKK